MRLFVLHTKVFIHAKIIKYASRHRQIFIVVGISLTQRIRTRQTPLDKFFFSKHKIIVICFLFINTRAKKLFYSFIVLIYSVTESFEFGALF